MLFRLVLASPYFVSIYSYLLPTLCPITSIVIDPKYIVMSIVV